MNHQSYETSYRTSHRALIGSIMMNIILVDNEEEKVEKLALVYAAKVTIC